MTSSPSEARSPHAGFSLIELAIVLVVAGLLAGTLLGALGRQRLGQDEQRAGRQLEQALEALYGFAIAHGHLPCPAAPQHPGTAETAGTEDCGREHGVLPWRTLALPETDPWGRRLTYYARQEFTRRPEHGARAGFLLETTGNASIRASAGSPIRLADDLGIVLLSHGARGDGGYRQDGLRTPATHADEQENGDADIVFVSRLPDDDFDDLVVWIVPDILRSRMLAAGRLP